MIELLLLVIGFIVVSGFFAMIDAAILNVNPAEVEVLLQKKAWGGTQLKKLLKHTTRAIIVIVIFTNVTNILGPILAGKKAVELFGNEAIGVITAVLTFGTIVFSEIIPKSIGAHYAPTISRAIAPLLLVGVMVLYPIVIALEWFARLFKSGKRHVGTEEQIRALANIGKGAGHIDTDEKDLIHRAFVLNDRTVADIMTPREKMVTVNRKHTILAAAHVVFDHHYSRYPLTNEHGEVTGYVLSRDVLEALANNRGKERVAHLRRKMIRVESSLKCDELLGLFRDTNAHLALVTEKKKTVGLVTLEDTLEELVGDIYDEGDVGSKPHGETS